MGNQRITAVIDMLRDAGIRADRGFPGAGMPDPDVPVVAVTLHEQTENVLRLAVTVYCTAEMGGAICEELAMDIGTRLQQMDASCTVGRCSFDSKAGLLTLPIIAVWETSETPLPTFRVQIGNQILTYLTSVSARHDQDYSLTDAGATVTEDHGWFITVTEKLPVSSVPEEETDLSFTLHILTQGGTESFPGCLWSQWHTEPVQDGIIRRRVAHTYSTRKVVSG